MQTMTQREIRETGLAALLQSLGPTGMVRFLQQYDCGEGDYTQDRKQQPSKTIDDILAERQKYHP
jgi:hypothetical protein